MTPPIFLFGTLRDAALLSIVAGAELQPRPARLPGYRVASIEGEAFPMLVAAPDARADGILVDPDPDARLRLDFYELGFGYRLEPRDIETDAGTVAALVYVAETDRWTPGADWSLTSWQNKHGALTREAAVEYMRLTATHAPEAAAGTFPQVRMRADSRLRARGAPSPAPFGQVSGNRDIAVHSTTQPYTDYFAVREDVLSFPLFNGDLSAPVRRASFQGGDAVTVLPYDPAADLVLMVRQFRHGVWCRGDANPWALETPAGRIDPGETPEQAARRELEEETGVCVTAMHPCGQYYPSPGAYSEFLYSYVGIADLSGRDGSVSGLDVEGEDIMAHVLSFGDAMDLIGTGAANTAPLILSLGWLAAHRDHLRG